VDYDRDAKTLRFSSDEELTAFHGELTALLREVTISVSSATQDAEQAKAGAREVLKQFRVVTRILNALRRAQPPRA
jgi:hypothetical protein